ncbi:hypothetical protein QTP88_002285 [Uroleucon formosanum]
MKMYPLGIKILSDITVTGWLGAMSTGVALLLSPVTIAFCRRKSTRLTAVMGGLITALGCLFTSFATQFHQLFFSYGTVIGKLMLVTATVFTTFLLGTCYRSASLYHPQRRAILHLKNQKRKIKDKNRHDDRPPFLDFTTLRSKTVRILLVSTGISAFGINTPIFYLAHQAEEDGLGDSALTLQVHMGLAWTVGCVAFGLIVVRNSVECRIARQYLCQASVFMCGVSILALTTVRGDRQGYVMFAWVYGMFCGGYHYSLKMYTYERVRARNFARTWGFVQCSQAIPIALGVPISGYINIGYGAKTGYYFSSACVLLGSLTMFFIDLHRRNVARHKHNESGTKKLCVSDSCPQRRRLSFTVEPEEVVVMEPPLNMQGVGLVGGAGGFGLMMGGGGSGGSGGSGGGGGGPNDKPELTCISEEGIADMDLPDNLLDDLDYIGDCITSCNKVENYLMLSEFENNLIAEMPVIMDRKGRRWSLAKQAEEETPRGGKWRLVAGNNSRMITVIDEASV